MELNKIYNGNSLDVLKTIPDESVDMVITSPPYWALRDYGVEGQLGLEATFQEYINNLCDIFNEVKRVLKSDGSCWVNLGDTYGGTGTGQEKSMQSKNKQTEGQYEQATKARNIKNSFTKGKYDKCLLQLPSRFAIEMTNRGWILRNEIIWHKPNAMPSSVSDRFTVDYEKLFFFTKNKKYYFEQQKEPMITTDTNSPRGSKGVIGQTNSGLRKQDQIGRNDYTGFNARYSPSKDLMRNKRCVWTISTKGLKEAHFATYPKELIITPIKACCPTNGIVLDPFMGSGTTALVAKELGLNYIGIELNEEYIKMAEKRLAQMNIFEFI